MIYRLVPIALFCCVQAEPCLASETEPPKFADATPQRYVLKRRASEIDSRAREHPEIDFVVADPKGKPADVQHAVVDTV